jgi:hypothetical protein
MSDTYKSGEEIKGTEIKLVHIIVKEKEEGMSALY